jgi:hypothetical protein
MPEKNLLVENVVPECGYHTYKTKEIGAIGYWSKFLEDWNNAKTVDTMLGLLHRGFTVSLGRDSYNGRDYSESDRLKFYFTVAEGWSDASLLRLTRDEGTCFIGYGPNGRIHKSQSEIWQTVAQKAFDMLALNLFSKMPDVNNEFRAQMWLEMVSDELFPAIQAFFRVDEEGEMPNGIPRYKEKFPHSWEICLQFILDFTKFLWSWSPKPFKTQQEEDLKTQSRIAEAKLLTVGVLASLHQLDVLDKWVPLDEQCVAKLKEIAMRARLGYVNKVETIDEACLAGSKAAWLVKKCELISHEKARLEKIREAEAAAKEATDRLKSLKRKR